MIGQRIGPYEVLAKIGEGGMGEVYRATDLKLKRQVAIKVLPSTVTADADRLARFQREAEVLAALNHPNIAAIFGLEEFDQAKALVMELVDGPTLADRIARGALPLDETLTIAKQIAAALEAAHEQGIVHRDLKPANIKVRPDGTVKVLDFGLAKALEPTVLSPGLSQSPTITSPAMTGVGVLLGTAAYMSPEQARGRSTDRRSDIWAFGCLVYEMLTGRRAFDGDDVVETIGAVVHKEPDWSSLPAAIPATVRLVLRRCLEKDVKKRIRDIGDVVLALDGAFETHVPLPSVRASRWRLAAIAATVAVGLVALVVSVLWWRPQSNSRVVRTSVIAPEGATIAPGVSITPDGSRIVFGNLQGLFIRALNQLEPVSIAAGRISDPFISPDGQWVGFWNDTRLLQKVAITGGAVLTVTQVASSGPRGSTWLPDDTIVFAANASGVGLQRVPAAGGTATVLTRPDRSRGEAAHVLPAALPGGSAVLFTIVDQTGGMDTSQIALYDVRSNTSKVLFRGGSHARYVSTGHLVYSTQGALRAVPFDLRRLEISGPSVPVEAVALTPYAAGAGFFDIANDGTLVYAQRGDRGGDRGGDRAVVWVDRNGHEESVPLPPRAYRQARLSPDGTRIVLFPGMADDSLWMWDLRRPALIRLTSGSDTDQSPVWTPDGQHVVFASTRDGGVYNLWRQATNGAGSPERLTTGPVIQFPTGITPDGTHVVFHQTTATGRDVMRLALDRTRAVAPLVQTPDDERNGIISADGHWLAYDSNSSGRFEVYVRPFPDTAAGFCLVSTSGGTRPLWSHQGKELFFSALDGAIMAVAIETTGTTCRAATPSKIIESGYVLSGGGNVIRAFDVSTDDQRLLMLKGPTAGSDSALPSVLVVVQNWTQELTRLAPKNR